MNLIGFCQYKTLCGWCSKWEKKCDKKIGGGKDAEPKRGLRAQGDVYDDNCHVSKDIIRKIIKETIAFEGSINKMKELLKENTK